MKQNKPSKCSNRVARSCFVICLIFTISFTFVTNSFCDTINDGILGNEFGSTQTDFNIFSHDVFLYSNTGASNEEFTRIISSFDNAYITGVDNSTTLTTPDIVTAYQSFRKYSDNNTRTSVVQTMILNEESIGNFLVQGELSIGGIILPYDTDLNKIIVNVSQSIFGEANITSLSVNVNYSYQWAHVQEPNDDNGLYGLTIDSKAYTQSGDNNGNVTLMSTSVRNALAITADNALPEGDHSVYYHETGTNNKFILVDEIVLRYTIRGNTSSDYFSYDLKMITDGLSSTPLRLQSDYSVTIAGVTQAFQYPDLESLGYSILSPINALFSTTIFFNVTLGSIFLVVISVKLIKVAINFFAGG